jgi:hypothetical protein
VLIGAFPAKRWIVAAVLWVLDQDV